MYGKPYRGFESHPLRHGSCQFPVASFQYEHTDDCFYQAPEVVQSSGCKPRQAGNGATVADRRCAAASPEPDQLHASQITNALSIRFNQRATSIILQSV